MMRIKWTNRALIALLALMALAVTPACTTSQKRVTYNTLYSMETTANAAYDSFIKGVIDGQVPETDVPKVAKAYNQFQAGMDAAIEAAQFDYASPAPGSLTTLVGELLDAIDRARKAGQ